jgi:hypothetical protein
MHASANHGKVRLCGRPHWILRIVMSWGGGGKKGNPESFMSSSGSRRDAAQFELESACELRTIENKKLQP